MNSYVCKLRKYFLLLTNTSVFVCHGHSSWIIKLVFAKLAVVSHRVILAINTNSTTTHFTSEVNASVRSLYQFIVDTVVWMSETVTSCQKEFHGHYFLFSWVYTAQQKITNGHAFSGIHWRVVDVLLFRRNCLEMYWYWRLVVARALY